MTMLAISAILLPGCLMVGFFAARRTGAAVAATHGETALLRVAFGSRIPGFC